MPLLEFRPSKPFTIGVELEFQLLDPTTFDLSPKETELLQRVEDDLQPYIKSEFIRSMVEICTPVCNDMTEVADNLVSLTNTVEELAHQCGTIIFASSLHPFARIADRQVTPSRRYHEIMNELQIAGRRLMTQALHVHIGLPDKKTTVNVCDAIRPYLPILLALTTSSPYLESENSGFHSYRTNLFGCLPRTGIPETLGSWTQFEHIIFILNQATNLNGIKELWWDVRPHPDFGTVEIRICDLPSSMRHILGIVALIQALVSTLSELQDNKILSREIIMHNKWHAARYGLAGTFIGQQAGKHGTFKDAASDLLDFVRAKSQFFGSETYLDNIRDILAHGTSAHSQIEIYNKEKDFRAVIETMQRKFWR